MELKLFYFVIQELGIDVLPIVVMLLFVAVRVILPDLLKLIQVGCSFRVILDLSLATLKEGQIS